MCLYPLNTKFSADLQTPKNLATLLIGEGKRGEGQWLGLSVCRGFYLDCSNLGEKLCDEWVLSASVCGTGSFSAHTAMHSINESAHETQSFSPKSRNPNKPKNSILNNSTSSFTIEP